MEIINIGQYLTLNLQTRVLSRTEDDRNVTLGVSASLCLESLVLASGNMLSLEELMNAGWGKHGIEVTSSSLRVAINQIRRALISLQVQDNVLIVTVPRSGYSLVINELYIEEEVNITHKKKATDMSVATGKKKNVAISPRVLIFSIIVLIFSGVFGVVLSYSVSYMSGGFYTSINYEKYNDIKGGFPAGMAIFVYPPHDFDDSQVEKTLNLWMKYSQDFKKHPFVYVNIGVSHYYYGLISCRMPLGKENNECKSVFLKCFKKPVMLAIGCLLTIIAGFYLGSWYQFSEVMAKINCKAPFSFYDIQSDNSWSVADGIYHVNTVSGKEGKTSYVGKLIYMSPNGELQRSVSVSRDINWISTIKMKYFHSEITSTNRRIGDRSSDEEVRGNIFPSYEKGQINNEEIFLLNGRVKSSGSGNAPRIVCY